MTGEPDGPFGAAATCDECDRLLEHRSPSGDGDAVYRCPGCEESVVRPQDSVPTRNDLVVEIGRIVGVSASSRIHNPTKQMCNSAVAYLTGEYPAAPGLMYAYDTPNKDALVMKLRDAAGLELRDGVFTREEMWEILRLLRESEDQRPMAGNGQAVF